MLDNKKRIENLKEKDYQELFGVKKKTFNELLKILEESYIKLHQKGGKPSKLSILDKLIITLCYYREYRTMKHIAFDYGVVKSTICDSIHWVESVLIKQERFHLPGKKSLLTDCKEIDTVLIDATEHEIERPQKNKNNGIQARKRNIPSKHK